METIDSTHPLLRELQAGEFWHCTRPDSFAAIRADAAIIPNSGKNPLDPRPSAAQFMNAVSLFDWLAPSWSEVVNRSDMWGYFGHRPLSIAIGLDPDRLPGEIVRYPDTRDLTSFEATGRSICGPFQFVEVFHVGRIPLTAATRLLVICPNSLSNFFQVPVDDPALLNSRCHQMAEFTNDRGYMTEEERRKDDRGRAQIARINRLLLENRRARGTTSTDKPLL